jgi:nucleoid-associated protein YgaU
MWEHAVRRETKFGLLVGLIFICLFGVILSGRARSSVQEHAAMPVGQSQDHVTKFKAINSNVDPFVKNAAPEGAPPESAIVADARDVAKPPAEEPMPAPQGLSPAEAAAPKATERGTVAFMPVRVETPSGAEHQDHGAAPLELPPDHVAAAPGTPVTADANRRVYVVKQGDTLVKVARQFFGKDGDRLASKIYEANKTAVKDPNRLAVGQTLVIPGVPADAPKTDAPKADTPRTDQPKKGLPAEPVSDAVYAKADKAAQPPLVIPTSYRKDAPGAPARLPAVAAVRDVTVQDLDRMYGASSDIVEMPSKPPATYTAQAGDTFYKIAEKKYGDGNKYGRLLFLKNQHLVSDPSKLKIGQRIVLLDGVNASDTAVALR